MANKKQQVETLETVVDFYCKACKGIGLSKYFSCPCDGKNHCNEAIASIRGSDSTGIVFGVKSSVYADVAEAIRKYAVEHGMRPEDVVFHATAKYMETAP